jgi:hypothetical protein
MRKLIGMSLLPVPIRTRADVKETSCEVDGIGLGSCSVTAIGISDFQPSCFTTK